MATSGAASDEVGSSRMRTRGLMIERLGDLDDLPAAEGQSADRHVQRFTQAELPPISSTAAAEAPIVDDPAPAGVGAEADVFRDGKMGREAQLLLHHGDAEPMSFARRQRRDRHARRPGSLRCRASACPTAG